MFKAKLTSYVTELRGERLRDLDAALSLALGIERRLSGSSCSGGDGDGDV